MGSALISGFHETQPSAGFRIVANPRSGPLEFRQSGADSISGYSGKDSVRSFVYFTDRNCSHSTSTTADLQSAVRIPGSWGAGVPECLSALIEANHEQWGVLKGAIEAGGQQTGMFDEIRVYRRGEVSGSAPFLFGSGYTRKMVGDHGATSSMLATE